MQHRRLNSRLFIETPVPGPRRPEPGVTNRKLLEPGRKASFEQFSKISAEGAAGMTIPAPFGEEGLNNSIQRPKHMQHRRLNSRLFIETPVPGPRRPEPLVVTFCRVSARILMLLCGSFGSRWSAVMARMVRGQSLTPRLLNNSIQRAKHMQHRRLNSRLFIETPVPGPRVRARPEGVIRAIF
jgi:hypothetical protein